ncbi:MAG: TRAP transporter small permease [Deltaproteobacteria bacterium]|nr:TRAP transporter small permease [Deltaproteobacteria bacterium]MBM4324228.1 TRAP transporter small permease [Deltaproteobacteria bacterium]
MASPFNTLRFVSKLLNIIAGISVTGMMLLTVADVLLRAFGHPIIGTYEIVALSLAFVIGFGIPQVSLDRGHVYMDLLLEKLSKKGRKVANTSTRVLCLILFAFLGYNLFNVGARFLASGEVSATIKIPFYPVAYGVAVCCLLECCVFIFDIVRIWRGEYE